MSHMRKALKSPSNLSIVATRHDFPMSDCRSNRVCEMSAGKVRIPLLKGTSICVPT